MAKTPPKKETASDDSELLSKIWAEIETYDSLARVFTMEGDRIYNLYINCVNQESSALDTSNRFDIVWSNTQLMQPVVFSQMPDPFVERRFKDKDPQGRRASLILERCIKSVLGLQDTVGIIKQSRDDFLLPGRGQLWCRYEPTFTKNSDSGEEELKYENVAIEYVPWKDFGYSTAKVWGGVKSVWRHLYLTKEDAKASLGEEAAGLLKYSYSGSSDPKRSKEETSGLHKRARVTEFWDVDPKMVYYISDSNKNTIIKKQKDKLKLKRFFPCPKPLFATKKTDNLIPVSDYSILKSLVDELDIVTLREAMMVDAMKASGVSSGQVAQALKSVFESDDNVIQPIKEWLQLKAQGGTQGGAIEWLPLDMFAKVLEQLRARKQELKADIYELSGISDVMRGVTNPYESGKALEQKSQWSSQRTEEKQRLMQEFINDTVNIVAEIISEHFDDSTIYEMAGVEMLGEEYIQNFQSDVDLLRNDVTRNFRIEVTIDSLVQKDEEKEKAAVNEFINAMSQIMGQSQAVLQIMPEMKPVILETLKFAARRYRGGRSLEGLLESTIDQALFDEQQRKMQPPPEDPNIAIDKMKVEVEQYKVEAKSNLDAQKAQHKTEIDNAKTQNDIMVSQAGLQIEQQKLAADRAKFELEQFKAQQKSQLDAANVQAKEREMALKDKIATADIAIQTAALKLQQAETKAANDIALLKLKAEATEARMQMALTSKQESEKLVSQERTAHMQTKQQADSKIRDTESKAAQSKGTGEAASVATAIAAALKNIPQPIINVEAPKPTKRVGRIERSKDGKSAKVVVEEEAAEGGEE